MKQPKVMGRQKVRGRIDFTTTLFPLHQKILHHWREATGLSLAAILRLLVEEHSDCRMEIRSFAREGMEISLKLILQEHWSGNISIRLRIQAL